MIDGVNYDKCAFPFHNHRANEEILVDRLGIATEMQPKMRPMPADSARVAYDKLDQKQTKALSEGRVAIMQPKTNHFAWTKTATIVQLHGMGPWGVTYVNPADDPRKK